MRPFISLVVPLARSIFRQSLPVTRTLTSRPVHMQPSFLGLRTYFGPALQATPTGMAARTKFTPLTGIRMLASSVLPKNVRAQHKKIIASITDKESFTSELGRIYSLIKHPDTSKKILALKISQSSFSEETKNLLRKLTDRGEFPLRNLSGLPDAGELNQEHSDYSSHSYPYYREPETDEAAVKKDLQTQLQKEKEQRKRDGHRVYDNTLETIIKDKYRKSKAESQITSVSFKDGIMYVHCYYYPIYDNFVKAFRWNFEVKGSANQKILLDLMSGKISRKEADKQVAGILFYDENSDRLGAKEFCYLFPGSPEDHPQEPVRVICESLEKELRKQIPHNVSKDLDRQGSFICPFDLVSDIISHGQASLNIHTTLASDQRRAVVSVLKLTLGDELYYNESVCEKKEKDKITFQSQKLVGHTHDLLQALQKLRDTMSFGWKRHGNVFVKAFPQGFALYDRLIFDGIAELAGIDDYDKHAGSLFRIKSEASFKAFLKHIDPSISLSQSGVITTITSSDHHEQDYLDAIKNDDENAVCNYLMDGADPELGIKRAAQCGNIRIADIFLNAGATLHQDNDRSKYPHTLLHIAAIFNHIDFAEHLVKLGIDVDRFSGNDYYFQTALYRVCFHNDNPEFIRLLVNAGANINIQNKDHGATGETPLHVAIEAGHVHSVRTLLELGADPRIIDDFDKTAFDHAIETPTIPRNSWSKEAQKKMLTILLEYAIDHNLDDEKHLLEEHGAKASKAYLVKKQASAQRTQAKFNLPPLIFFEKHNDPAGRIAIHQLLPWLKELGYKGFCFENDSSLSIDDVMKTITFMLTKTLSVVKKVRNNEPLSPTEQKSLPLALSLFPAELALLHLLSGLQKYGITYQGVDDDFGEQRFNGGLLSHEEAMLSMEARDPNIAKRIADIAKQCKGGTVTILGSAHQPGVDEELNKHLTNTDQDSVLSLNVHSSGLEADHLSGSPKVHFVGLDDIENPDEALNKIKEVIENKMKDMQQQRESAQSKEPERN